MKILRLEKKIFPLFMYTLVKHGEIWGPVRRNEKHAFQRINHFTEADLNATRTLIPPKKFFVPSKFNMFTFDAKGYVEQWDDFSSKILFGVHPCDIHGIRILDKLFSTDYPDPYYLKRRENTIIIGYSCVPDEKCFCNATQTSVIDEGFDLFFTDLNEFYLVWVGSSKGDDLIKLNPELFDEKLQKQDIEKFLEWKKWRDDRYTLQLDFTVLPDMMELRYSDQFWEEMATSCFACGSCSMVCPTCNCYNVHDHFRFGKEDGERSRFWDSCMFREYSLVAGGHNFREKKADRLKLWYTHKLQAFIGQFGKPSCVGCGRCIDTCPVDINVMTVAWALRDVPFEAFWKRQASKEAR